MELLLPAGDLDRLKTAFSFGADAVYLGGEKFGMRTRAGNFSLNEIKEGIKIAHHHGGKVFITINSFLHDKDLEDLPEFISFLSENKADALIISDLGVLETAKKYASSDLEFHLSTQSSCLNSYGAALWKSLGINRIVLGREVSLEEAALIKKEAGIEVELFIHGSMCMSYSGHCTISNFTAGRDSNRGGCAHSCRFEYSIGDKKGYFLSSKDLNGLKLLPLFKQYGIDSLKIEGRMKSPLYVATLARVYRRAIDSLDEIPATLIPELIPELEEELKKIPYREYTQAFFTKKAGDDSIASRRESSDEIDEYMIAGRVLEVHENEFILLEVLNTFHEGDELEFVVPSSKNSASEHLRVSFIRNVLDEVILKTKPSSLVKIPYMQGIKPYSLARARKRSF